MDFVLLRSCILQTQIPNPFGKKDWGASRRIFPFFKQHGKWQQYALGRHLRRMYNEFITSSPVEVDVQSSRRHRCLLSALCNVAALYAPSKDWEFAEDFHWQPIPVSFVPTGKDRYLGSVASCPAAEREMDKVIESEEGQNFIKAFQNLFDFWSHHSRMKIKTWTDAASLFDVLTTENAYNYIIPPWAHKHWKELHYVSDMSFYLSAKTERYQRLRAGPLLHLITENMKTKSTFPAHKTKVVLFSGHSKNLVAVLSALGVFNMKEPPFCSSLILELYEEADDHSVRLLFMNSSTPETEQQVPHILQLEGCGEFCPFEYFTERVKNLIPNDWEEECHS